MRDVLVVDDDERIADGFARAFARSSSVRVAHSVREATAMLAAAPAAIAIVDLQLDDGSGLDVVRAAKERRRDAKVVVVSGYLTVEYAAHVVRAGADIALPKPVSPTEVLRRVAPTYEPSPRTPTLEEAERELITRVLTDCEDNVSEAARRLGIARSTLQRKLRRS